MKVLLEQSLPSARWEKVKKIARWIEWEAVFWVAGLGYLALSDPTSPDHFTLFLPYYLFGIRSPGYNLGHSIAFLFHGQIVESFQAHWLGIPVVLILTYRIACLIRRMILRYPIYFKGENHV